MDDFVTGFRNVCLAIIALSISLFFAAVSVPPDIYERAIAQLDQMDRIARIAQNDWIQSYFRKQYGPSDDRPDRIQVPGFGLGEPVVLDDIVDYDFKGASLGLSSDQVSKNQYPPDPRPEANCNALSTWMVTAPSSSDLEEGDAPTVTVETFKERWDSPQELTYLRLNTPKIHGFLVGGPNPAEDETLGNVKPVDIDVTKDGPQRSTDDYDHEAHAYLCPLNATVFSEPFLRAVSGEAYNRAKEILMIRSSNLGPFLFIPLYPSNVTVVAKQTVTKIANFVAHRNVRDGDFSDSFPDIAQLSDGLEELPDPQLRHFLLKQQKDVSAQIDIAGVSIPTNMIFYVGIPFLSLLAYLIFRYTSVLSDKIDLVSDSNPAWEIALAEVYFSPLLILLGMVVLPSASITAQLWRLYANVSMYYYYPELVIGILAVVILLASARNLLSLSRVWSRRRSGGTEDLSNRNEV